MNKVRLIEIELHSYCNRKCKWCPNNYIDRYSSNTFMNDEIFEKIIDKTKFSHIPESMIHSESHNMIHELKKNVEQQGGKFEDYLMHVKKTSEELEQDFKPDAAKRVKTSLMISQVVKAEKIEVAKEELEAKVVESLKAYESNEEMKKKADTAEFRNYLQYNLLNQKVIEKLKEWNVA